MTSFEQLVSAAHSSKTAAQSMLYQLVDKVGMTPLWSGDSPQVNLANALETYVIAAARYEMLTILRSEDFYVAMVRSAGAGSDAT